MSSRTLISLVAVFTSQVLFPFPTSLLLLNSLAISKKSSSTQIQFHVLVRRVLGGGPVEVGVLVLVVSHNSMEVEI
jgi:hypothetical protein